MCRNFLLLLTKPAQASCLAAMLAASLAASLALRVPVAARATGRTARIMENFILGDLLVVVVVVGE